MLRFLFSQFHYLSGITTGIHIDTRATNSANGVDNPQWTVFFVMTVQQRNFKQNKLVYQVERRQCPANGPIG